MPLSESAAIDKTTDARKVQATAKHQNALAVAILTMVFETEGLLGMIFKAMSNVWPTGLAYIVVVVQLVKKCNPNDRVSQVELIMMLNRVTMKVTEDPSILFEQVSAIQNQYDTVTHKIDEEELIAAVMGAAPKEYISVITTKQRAKSDMITLEDLDAVLYEQYHQTDEMTEQEKGTEAKKILNRHKLHLKDTAINVRSKVTKRILVQIESSIAGIVANKAIMDETVGSKKRIRAKDLKETRCQTKWLI
jgi:hypothetical protein